MRPRGAEKRRGVSTVIGVTIILASLLISVGSMIALEAAFQFSASVQDDLQTRKRAESFFILSSTPNGTQLVMFNNGPNLLHLVSVYVNHRLTANLSFYIVSQTSGTIPSGTTMLLGDSVDVLSDLGNRATSTFPIIPPGGTITTNNKYVGTGPLGITFANWSFVYQNYVGTGSCNPPPVNFTAWTGIPGQTQPVIWVALVNHASGNITLLDSTNLNFVTISDSQQNVKGYFIVDQRSTPCSLVQYNNNSPYLIPQNPTGDIASGGPSILVGFAAASIACSPPNSNNCQPNQLWNPQGAPLVVAVFISVVFKWNGNIFSEDIPFAALRICPGVCT